MTPQLTPTEIEELNIAIAEDCGHKDVARRFVGNPLSIGGEFICSGIVGQGGYTIPPYTTSIDAIREAAMERFKLFADSMEFNAQLGIRASELANTIGLSQWKWQLTALDWAIAFARTAKIWRYK